MNYASTLTEVVQTGRHARRNITYVDGEESSRVVSFAEMYDRALGVLYHLERLGARRGDKLILCSTDNETFISAFWAAILGGITPVPVSVGSTDEHRAKLLRIARALGQPFLYTDRRSLDRVANLAAQSSEDLDFDGLRARTLLSDDVTDLARAGTPVPARPDEVALIQFSSGSTSEPKGVVLTHANIVANCRSITEATLIDDRDVSLSWMPLTHDMGLIGFHLVMFANGVETYLMPTDLFMRRPLLWLALAARTGASLLSSPNFGYRHYLNALADRPVDTLDLSPVRIIFNGAEPISAELCEEFLTRLAPANLSRTSMFPVYGLAEASLAVAFPPVNAAVRTVVLDRRAMQVGSDIIAVVRSNPSAIEIVNEGRPLSGCKVRITGDDDEPLDEGRVGHIHISGVNVTRGYYQNPTSDAQVFTHDGWVRTGDLGFILDGDVHVSGRSKDIIFVDGQNYYPHDLEAIAHQSGAVEAGRIVVAGVRPPGAQTDRLIVFVIHREGLSQFVPIAARLARIVSEGAGVRVAEVVPVKRIPKTTSGKAQRHLLVERYGAGDFDSQLARLRALRDAGETRGSDARTGLESTINNILVSLLEGRTVGRDDNVFEIGATSLTLIQIHERIDQIYPGAVQLSELFEFPTVAELARHIEGWLARPAPAG
jgi:acyl-CoA synthetase (AMP-forming)/AMP-acid ligase II